MTSTLSEREKALLYSASSEVIEGRGEYLIETLQAGRWLDSTNQYGKNPVRQIRSEERKDRLRRPELLDYIAASCPLHLYDGWSYYGKALYSQIMGLPGLAVHLGYYAELRAAMSILAAQGIGVFDRDHAIVSGDATISLVSRSTHQATWEYLEFWATLAQAQDLVGTVVQPRSTALADWVRAMPSIGERSWDAVGSNLIHNLGWDLERFAYDRDIRNSASYRPSGFVSDGPLALRDAVTFVVKVVRAFEPSGLGGAFDTLDLDLLGTTIAGVYSSVTDKSPLDHPRSFREEVDAMLLPLIGEPSVRQEIRTFLTGISEDLGGADLPLTRLALEQSALGDPRPLLGRGALLLRIATGAARRFLLGADIEPNQIEWWWNAKGKELGLWEDAKELTHVSDA